MQLAPSTLPLGRRGVNPVEMAKHVEPIAEFWRTGVQIPPAPPNTNLDLSQTVYEPPQEARPVRVFLFLAVFAYPPPARGRCDYVQPQACGADREASYAGWPTCEVG